MSSTKSELEANYAAAFDGCLAFGTTPALLIIDVVMAYFDKASPLYAGVELVLAANKTLLAKARLEKIPVIFTNVAFVQSGVDGGVFYQKLPALAHFVQGSPLGEFPPDLQPTPVDLVITKQYASAFFGTSLCSTLNAMRVDTLLITGLSTSGCVRATAVDACQYGFKPFVVRDACGDRHSAPHEANLFDLQAKYAEVISLEDAIRLMSIT